MRRSRHPDICFVILALRRPAMRRFPGGTLSMTHDEVLMLIISVTVIVEIATTFRYLRRIPHLFLLLGSFAALALDSIFTVAEGLVWTGLFNVLEHISIMAGAILFALWCGLVFGPQDRRFPDAPRGLH